jgi:hypothetical protein
LTVDVSSILASTVTNNMGLSLIIFPSISNLPLSLNQPVIVWVFRDIIGMKLDG